MMNVLWSSPCGVVVHHLFFARPVGAHRKLQGKTRVLQQQVLGWRVEVTGGRSKSPGVSP